MGGILAPSTTIGGSVLSPGIPLLSSPFSGLFQDGNGLGIGINSQEFFKLNAVSLALGATTPSTIAPSNVAGSPYAVPGPTADIVVTSDGAAVFVSCGTSTSQYAFSRNPTTGVLTPVPGSPFASTAVSASAAVACTPSGKVVVSGINTGPNTVGTFTRNLSTGVLTYTGLYAIPNGNGFVCFDISRDGKHLYGGVSGVYGAGISCATINDTTGALAAVGSYANPGGYGTTQSVKVSSDGKWVFGTSAGVTGAPFTYQTAVYGYSRNSITGALTAIPGATKQISATVNMPVYVAVSPDSSQIAVSAWDSSFGIAHLHIFNINQVTGELTEASFSPVVALGHPSKVNFSPDGALLFVASSSGGYSIYNRNVITGQLTVVAGSPFGAGGTTSGIVSSPDSSYVLMGDNAGGVYAQRLAAIPAYNLLTAQFDPSGGLGGGININGSLNVSGIVSLNGGAPATFPATAGQDGKFLQLSAGVPAWTPLNKYIPVAMVANAGAFTVDTDGEYIVDVTGVLTGTGTITYAATIVPLPTTVIFNNMTTGGFPLVLNAGGFIIPPGKSTWYWDGATLKIVTQNTLRAQSLAMVANAGALTLYDHCDNYVSVTGVLTANGQITTTFPTNATQVTFNNATTGAFLLQINAGTYTLPFGKSVWTWDGAAFTKVLPLIGVTNNSAAIVGEVGEYFESVQMAINVPGASGAWGDLTSIALQAGDYDIDMCVTGFLNGSTLTRMLAGISITPGNAIGAMVGGDTLVELSVPTAATNISSSVPSKRFSFSAATTVYLKELCNYAAGNPQMQGRLSVRRVR